MIKAILNKLVEKQNLTQQETETVMNDIMSGNLTDAQIACFLTALRMKGETIEEITGCAKVMREKAVRITPKVGGLIDVVGTGGDNSGSFNISTTTAFVIAGAGIPVAKHGIRSVSSKSGSGDVLEKLGVNIDIDPERAKEVIEKIGICYLFAPIYHPSYKYVLGPRKEMGIRTVFNVLGSLCNPAFVKYQVEGVYDKELVEPLAYVLSKLGLKRTMVVHGSGMDEFTLTGTNYVAELKNNIIKTYEITPEEFGFEKCSLEELKGGTPEKNAKITLNILNRRKGPKRDVVLLNAGAAIYVSGKADSIEEGIELASKSIDSGKALEKLNMLVKESNK